MKYALLSILLTLYSCNINKDNEYIWFTETREYRGTYDAEKYSREQIEGAAKLSSPHFGSFEKTVFSDSKGYIDATEIREKSEADILKQHNDAIAELENLQIINNDV